jgi:hypothetical protein
MNSSSIFVGWGAVAEEEAKLAKLGDTRPLVADDRVVVKLQDGSRVGGWITVKHRHQGTFLQELLKPFGTEVLYEKVHMKDDLRRFLQMAKRDPNIPYTHYVGHGDGGNRALLGLTFDDVDPRQDMGIMASLTR